MFGPKAGQVSLPEMLHHVGGRGRNAYVCKGRARWPCCFLSEFGVVVEWIPCSLHTTISKQERFKHFTARLVSTYHQQSPQIGTKSWALVKLTKTAWKRRRKDFIVVPAYAFCAGPNQFQLQLIANALFYQRRWRLFFFVPRNKVCPCVILPESTRIYEENIGTTYKKEKLMTIDMHLMTNITPSIIYCIIVIEYDMQGV